MMLYQIINPVIPGLSGKKPDDAPALFAKFFAGLVGAILVFATIFAFAQLLQGSLEWITSGGDKTAVENARNRITHALLGLLIAFAAWSIFLIILQFLGISPLGVGNFEFKIPSLLEKST